jgi:transcriptional regulator with XRE-family HTH domain
MAFRADRLRALREQRNWSQRELGRYCDIGAAQISKYESGETDPSMEILVIIANKLNVSADYLVGLSDIPYGMVGDGEISEIERAMINIYRREGWPGVFRMGADRVVDKEME